MSDFGEILSRNMRAMAMGAATKGQPMKVFDWDKAASIIREHNITDADAGLVEDWFWTGASILEDGKVPDREGWRPHCSSSWATPVIRWGEETRECWVMQDEAKERGFQTGGAWWPDSALAILNRS